MEGWREKRRGEGEKEGGSEREGESELEYKCEYEYGRESGSNSYWPEVRESKACAVALFLLFSVFLNNLQCKRHGSHISRKK